MADKQVKIEVLTEAKMEEVKALESEIQRIKQQKLQLNIEANTAKLQETEQKIESTKAKLKTLQGQVDVDDSELKQVEEELARLESDKLNIQLDIEKDKLASTKQEIDALDDDPVTIQVDNISAMQAVDQIGQGFDRLKQGASEIGQQMGGLLESAGRMEQTEAFLSMNMGADEAKQKLQEIRSVTDSLPGDDVTLQNLLSQAAMKDASMTTDAFNQMGSAAADYMAAMQNFGKTSTETQQDLMNYILAGNTAEIERSPILQSHIDKLKEGTTVQERAKLLQEALTEEGWAGIASQDIYNNKLQQFNDMIERGKMNLGGMFQEGAKSAMDLVMQLDNATGGAVGMTIALAGFASPITDAIMGVGQIGMGLKNLKEASDWIGITDKLGKLKQGLLDVASAAKNAAVWLLDAGKKALIAGYNALKSAALWAYEKLAKVASTVASYALSAAQAVLNAVMSMNPIMLVVIALIALAAAFIWAYNNVDWFREMVDNAWASITGFASWLSGEFMAAINGVGDAFNNAGQMLQNAFTGAVEYVKGVLQGLYDYIMTLGGLIPEGVNITGNQIVDSILAFMAFMATLPFQISMIFINIIASLLGFGDNFCQNMIQTGVTSVTGFLTQIGTLPGRLSSYLMNALSTVMSWGASIVSQFLSAASRSVSNFASQIAQIPQVLATELGNALNKVEEWAATLPQKFWDAGVNAVKNFLSALGIGSPGTMQRTLVWEVSEMARRTPIEGKHLKDNIKDLGHDVVDAFGHPNLGVGFDDTVNSSIIGNAEAINSGALGQVNNFYFSDIVVDNEERMNKIVDYVRREIAWNNMTANRNVSD